MTSFALVIDHKNAVQKTTTTGADGPPSAADIALEISVCANGTIWVVSEDSDQDTQGGNKLKFSIDGGQTYNLPGGKAVGGKKVAGAPDGSCWFIDGDNSVLSLTTSGVVERIAPAETALEIAIDAKGRVWVLSTQVNTQLSGNIVMATTTSAKAFNAIPGNPVADKIAGWQDGSCWIVTTKGEVGFIQLEGGTGLLSPAGQDIALSISMSPNLGTCWIIGTKQADAMGNAVQYWDQMGTGSENWKVVPGVKGKAISGGG